MSFVKPVKRAENSEFVVVSKILTFLGGLFGGVELSANIL